VIPKENDYLWKKINLIFSPDALNIYVQMQLPHARYDCLLRKPLRCSGILPIKINNEHNIQNMEPPSGVDKKYLTTLSI